MTDLPSYARKAQAGWSEFQARHGLGADGMPGLRTLAKVLEIEKQLGDRPPRSEAPAEGFSYGGEDIRRGVSRDPSLLLPGFAAKAEVLFQRMRKQGHDPMLWEGYRSPERAQDLSDRGAGIKLSMHTLGCAIDVVHRDDYWSAGRDFWDCLGEESEALGLTWGGRWRRRDYPHVQAIAVRDQAKLRAMSEDERRDFIA